MVVIASAFKKENVFEKCKHFRTNTKITLVNTVFATWVLWCFLVWAEKTPIQRKCENVKNDHLESDDVILLSALHIKFGLQKNFVEAMPRNGIGFIYLKEKFLKLSKTKIKEGIFVGSQLRQLIKNKSFEEKLINQEKLAWKCLVIVVQKFLGNHKSENYNDLMN